MVRPEQEQNKLSTRKRAASSTDSKYFFAKHGMLLQRSNSVPVKETHLDKKASFKPQMTFDSGTAQGAGDVANQLTTQNSRSKPQSLADIEDDPFAEEAGSADESGVESIDPKKHLSQIDAEELCLQASIKEMKVTGGDCKNRASSVSTDSNIDRDEMIHHSDRLGSLTETGVVNEGHRSGSHEFVNEKNQGVAGNESIHRTFKARGLGSSTGSNFSSFV